MTALSWVRLFGPGTNGVQMLRKRQSSLPDVLPAWMHWERNARASMVLLPVYGVGYSNRAGGFANGIPKNLNDAWSRKL